MSSNRRRRSLRTRLIAVLVAALAVICLIVAAATELALRDYLVGRLDSQVRAAAARTADFDGPPPWDPEQHRPDPGGARGLAPGTVTAVVMERAGEVGGGELDYANRQSEQAQPVWLAPEQSAALLEVPADGQVHTRRLGELGDYRITAVRTDYGDVVVTGLPMSDVYKTLLRVGIVLGGVSLAGLLATGVVGALLVRRTLRPLERVAEVATEVTELPLDRGEVAVSVRVPDADPATEVGRVGTALNIMLGHVDRALSARHRSESRVRRFVADASHELRTPLASIRGYAELAQRYSNRVPADVRHAMGRVEAESNRMTALVEELLLLAKLDSGRQSARTPVDLSRLVSDAVADARVAGPDHRWRLAVPAEPVTVTGDPGQLYQVVINLLANARTHTPPGTMVHILLSREDGVVRLAVADDGPGIPAELLPEVFERFTRADVSRSRTAGGTGLGLAIVAAIVARHGGEVAASSQPHRTEFAITLPVTATT
jgi:two-component system OmpR family sensor kinase